MAEASIHVCCRCHERAVVREPWSLCRFHATEFYQGLVAVGAATARVHRSAPGNVDVTDLPEELRIVARRLRASPGIVVEIVCTRCGKYFATTRLRASICPTCRSKQSRAIQRALHAARLKERLTA